jgi:hypothetical protein
MNSKGAIANSVFRLFVFCFFKDFVKESEANAVLKQSKSILPPSIFSSEIVCFFNPSSF